MSLNKKYTVILRKSKLLYVAICLELNIAAQGDTLAEVEKNLKVAIDLYLEDIKKNPETIVNPISIQEIIEFLKDTEPEWHSQQNEHLSLMPFEIHEVAAYV